MNIVSYHELEDGTTVVSYEAGGEILSFNLTPNTNSSFAQSLRNQISTNGLTPTNFQDYQATVFQEEQNLASQTDQVISTQITQAAQAVQTKNSELKTALNSGDWDAVADIIFPIN